MKALTAIPQAVSLEEYKRAVHILDEDDNTLFTAYLKAGQEVVEDGSRRPMLPRSVKFDARLVGASRWWFPVCPVASLTALSWRDSSGAVQALDVASVQMEMADDEPQLVFPAGFWDGVSDGMVVSVTATVGYANGQTPERLKEAVILLAKDWYDAGIAVEEKKFLEVSFGCKALMRQMRYKRPAVVEWA